MRRLSLCRKLSKKKEIKGEKNKGEEIKGEEILFRFFMGSDFALDETEDAAYRLINDIILCMEQGISCVLVNQSIIY